MSRPDIIAMAADAGEWDRSAFEAGYALHVAADLLGAVAGGRAVAQFATRRAYVPALTALCEHVGGELTEPDPDGDTDDVVLVQVDFTGPTP